MTNWVALFFTNNLKEIGANVPKVRKEDAFRIYQKMAKANENKLIESSHDISDGGLAVAIAECCFGNQLGAKIKINNIDFSKNAVLFSESHSRFVVSVCPENQKPFEEIFW